MTHSTTFLDRPTTAAEIRWARTQDAKSAWGRIADYTPTDSSSDSIIARMDEIKAQGQYDRDGDGLRRLRQGRVGGNMMTCQVAVLGGDTLITFWSITGDGHQRRFLVQVSGQVWMDTRQGRAIRPGTKNKYAEPLARVMAARAN